VGLHLESCPSCREEFDQLLELRVVLQTKGRQHPEPPAWESVEATVSSRLLPKTTGKQRTRVSLAMAASVGVLAFVGLIAVWLFQGGLPKNAELRGEKSEQIQILTAGLPGLGDFLLDQDAEEVVAGDLFGRLGFVPQAPEVLPGGFRLAKTYLVFDPCGTGCCIIYERGNEIVSLIQDAPSRPVRWALNNLENCSIAGRSCRRGGNQQLEIVQIEPEGKNLTIVAQTGAIDPAVLVEALTGD
ncbi:MAG TPA: hypothetical protein VMY18_08760, partial [Acidobacteriota bacterium]|nr:hypothetical protein [Acidobacteriota bacterium]